MNKFKGRISLVLLLAMILSVVPVFADEEIDLQEFEMQEIILPEVSKWAETEIIDAVRYGFYNKSLYNENNNLKEKINNERAESLKIGLINKLEGSGLKKNADFKKIETGSLEKRSGILKEIYNIMGQYDNSKDISKDPIMYLNHIGVVKGNGKDLYLNRDITTEETIIFMKRAIEYIYNKENISAKGVLWEVENKGNKVYLLGSIHIADSNLYPFSKEIMKRYEESDALYVEVDISDQKASQEILIKKLEEEAKKLHYQDGTKLKDIVGEEVYNSIKKIMDEYEVEEESYNTMKPYGIISQIETFTLLKSMEDSKGEDDKNEINEEDTEKLLEMLEFMTEGADYGVDMYFLLKAKADKKKIVELESLEMQYELLTKELSANPHEKLSQEDQIKKLKEVIESFKNPKKIEIETTETTTEEDPIKLIKDMLASWKAGDTKKLNEILASQNASEALGGKLLGERDKAMAKKISEILESDEGKTSFVVVGAAHYVTEGMTLDNLKAMGYRINRVK